MNEPTKPVDQMSYEEALQKLEEIIATLEGDPASLEEALTLFERGQELLQHCAALLDQAELRVRQVTLEENDGDSG